MSAPSRWDDLSARTISGVAIAVVALGATVAGGVWFQMLAVFCAAVMVWELWMMIRPDAPENGMMMAALAASALSGVLASESWVVVALLMLVPLIGAALVGRERLTFAGFALGIQLAAWGLVALRLEFGMGWTLWLIGVVVATDVAGYFAGKHFGGPKFWPRISPKKTWSGTAAGWIAAAALGALAAVLSGGGLTLVVMAVALSFASQMGDITESALKRRMAVKDSSALIPGHGGLFDRFDGLLGATLLLLVLSEFNALPLAML